MRLSDALRAKYEAAPLSECAGRVSTEFICLYPPGIPIVAPGERVTEAIARRVLRWFAMGLPVHGMAEGEARRLRVAARAARASVQRQGKEALRRASTVL